MNSSGCSNIGAPPRLCVDVLEFDCERDRGLTDLRLTDALAFSLLSASRNLGWSLTFAAPVTGSIVGVRAERLSAPRHSPELELSPVSLSQARAGRIERGRRERGLRPLPAMPTVPSSEITSSQRSGRFISAPNSEGGRCPAAAIQR